MPRHGGYGGGSAPVPDLRPRRMLRRIEEQACHQAFPFDPASDHHLARTRGGLELVLHRRGPVGASMSESAAARVPSSPWSPLRSGLFRNIWIASIVSNVGGWMQDVGAGWLMTSLS